MGQADFKKYGLGIFAAPAAMALWGLITFALRSCS